MGNLYAPPFPGYRIDLERIDSLVESATPFRFLVDEQYTAPDEIDPRTWHVIEDQGNMGSCQGHAQTSVCEYAYRIATGGQVTQFSEMFGYLTSQKIDGLIGRDQGSTIEGGMQAAKKYGCCPVEVFPYPSRYTSTIPENAYSEAAPFKIRSHSVCTSYEDIFAYLASGQGGVEIGMTWNNSMTPDAAGVVESYSPGGTGGHALAFLGYALTKDSQGRNYLWLANSWSPRWGAKGWAMVAPRAVDQIMRARWSVAIGLSDLSVPEPRKIDWRQWEIVG